MINWIMDPLQRNPIVIALRRGVTATVWADATGLDHPELSRGQLMKF
jgi:hypothetical protein